MKISHIKLAIAALAIMLCSTVSFAQDNVTAESAQYMGDNPYTNQSVLTLINNTDATVYASFVYFDPIDQCWISRGWRTIKPHQRNPIILGVYSGNVYIHGYQPEGRLKWGKGYSFGCEDKFGYRLLHADGANCTYTDGTIWSGKRKNYTLVPVNLGDNVYEFND